MEIPKGEALLDNFVTNHQLYKDKRGHFVELYNRSKQKELENVNFIQSNCSFSYKKTLRGLHFQINEFAQEKYIFVVSGAIFDVIVDINPTSLTYGHWWGNTLNQNESLFIDSNYAHGFYAIEDSLILYNVTNPYNKDAEKTIIWDDKDLNIDWPIKDRSKLIMSEKDKNGVAFKSL